MVFVPTIQEAKLLHRFLSLFLHCHVCTSKTDHRDQVIEAFRREKSGVIVATTVLERGVTIPGADICVFHADHGVFDEASLVQMAGRAGRSFDHPGGSVLFLELRKSRPAAKCRDTIREANACAA
jgi:competence protein ComFA